MKKSSNNIDENYIKENADSIKEEDMNKVLNNEVAVQQKMKQLHKLKNKIGTLFQLLKDFKNRKYTQTPWMSVAAIIFALLYMLNPLDLVPDFIPFIGYIDDASVLALTFKMISSDIDDYLEWQEKNEILEKNQ